MLEPEEGLLIGNGDLSVSIYQACDRVIWRFGKNDVWDRRLDLSDSPEPAHIDEIARGVGEEGWTNNGFIDGHGESRSRPADPDRMREICDGWPAYARRPYPCPKPVGELALHLPPDQAGFSIKQLVDIERGVANLSCTWQSGLAVDLECFVAPSPNVLVVNWNVSNWTEGTSTGSQVPVWFSLYRWADPTIETWTSELFAQSRYKALQGSVGTGKTVPLPGPVVRQLDGHPVIEQAFYPDMEFPEGFTCLMAPVVSGLLHDEVPAVTIGEARIHLCADTPVLNGRLAVSVTTSTDTGGAQEEMTRVLNTVFQDLNAVTDAWRAEAEADAVEFWSRSSVSLSEQWLEDTWYETLHARRSTFRHDRIAPGLMLPSTIRDYSLWHGDYHTNYNYQSPFWGDYTANQLSLGDSFFPGMKYMVDLGRKLASEYWSYRGTFIHLTGFPFEVSGDPYGSGPLCRLAYMTGWVANHYWYRYLYTQDDQWLESTGYPVIKDCALFYLDFLKEWDDGLYHAFPSGQGESFFTGSSEDYTDRPQVVRHIRYCLQAAVTAAELLECDESLAAEWRDRLELLVCVDDLEALGYSTEERRKYQLNSPEFISYDVGDIETRGNTPECLIPSAANPLWRGYFGQLPWRLMIAIRNQVFDATRDMELLKAHLDRWRLPNGLFRGMSAGDFGRTGVLSECMGILAPIQEMLIQSWDGVIRVFPAWPLDRDASFRTLRAENAFLVSAELLEGNVREIDVESLVGGVCRLAAPWRGDTILQDEHGGSVASQEKDGILTFDTEKGRIYRCLTSPNTAT